MNPEIMWITIGVGGVFLVTGLLAAKEYNEMTGPSYRSRPYRPSELPDGFDNNPYPQIRLSNTEPYPRPKRKKYGWTNSDIRKRTIVRNQNEDIDYGDAIPNRLSRSDYAAIAHRPSNGWKLGGSKRKTMKK